MMRFRSGNGIWIMTNKKEYELRPLDLLFSFICINVISLVYDTRVPAASQWISVSVEMRRRISNVDNVRREQRFRKIFIQLDTYDAFEVCSISQWSLFLCMNYGHKSRSPDIDKLSGIEKRFHMNSQDKKLILFNDRAVPSSLQNHENGQLYRVRFDGQVYFNINPRISASSSAPLTSRPTNWCCFLLPFIWLVCCFCPLPGPRSSASLLFNEVTQTGVNVCEQVEQFNVQCQSRVSNCCRN